ncbi:MAG TPA: hypothetical protein VM689_09340 [Aliidongia sp.]|nr:hypothetical protein [Aliidongia sp.]
MQPTMTPKRPEMKMERATKTDPALERKQSQGGSGQDQGGGDKRGSGRGAWIAGAVLLAIVVGGGAWFMNQPGADTPHVGISTTLGDGEAFGGAVYYTADDQVSDKQWQERADAFKSFKAKGPVLLDRAEAAQVNGFVNQAIPDAQKRQVLAKDIQDKKVDMVAIGFYDDCAVDGDTVGILAGGVDITIPLTHQVQYVLVPVPHGGSAPVTVQGLKDGTGGITLGMVTPAGVVHMPALKPGQQIGFTAR